MLGSVENLWSSGSFIPHGHCYLWQPQLVSLHILSDSIIALAYYSIPITLVYFVQKRKDLPFDWVFLLFSAFIVSCGTTHLMEVWTLWHPTYWLAGALKALTAVVSLYTAISLVLLMPQALTIPSPAQLSAVNLELTQQIRDRQQAEAQVRQLNQDLEIKVAQRTAELEERNSELNNFVHVVSHDLKAPLRAISNLSEWIEEELEGSLSPDTQNQMALLRNRVYRMETMINGLLNYARVGRTDSLIEQVAVAELLIEVIDSVAPPPTFTITLTPNLPILYTKSLLLFQVFANLISNGIKHHDRVDGSINISAKDRGDFYEFAVADDGAGIAIENQENIFKIFQTGNRNNNPDSTGIGLAIVKKIVEAETGTIRLESELDKGTTFYFTWPKESPVGT